MNKDYEQTLYVKKEMIQLYQLVALLITSRPSWCIFIFYFLFSFLISVSFVFFGQCLRRGQILENQKIKLLKKKAGKECIKLNSLQSVVG
jgi:hypothetical protein